MRTWIVAASFVIAEAISPGHEYPMVLGISIIIILVGGALIDLIEFIKKL